MSEIYDTLYFLHKSFLVWFATNPFFAIYWFSVLLILLILFIRLIKAEINEIKA